MFHWWVLIIIAGFNALLFFGALRFVYHYMHVDDFRYNQGILGQIVAVLGIQLVYLLLCVLPVDVYNAKFDGGYNMSYFWQLVYLFLSVYLSTILPYSIFFYEADSDPRITKTAPWRRALYLTAITTVATWAVVGLLYLLVFKVTVPSYEEVCINYVTNPSGVETCTEYQMRETKVQQNISFLDYLIALPGFVGWIMFVFQGGLGLASFPLSLLQRYLHRPRPISQAQYEKHKRILGERAALLRGVGETLRAKELKIREGFSGLRGTGGRLKFRQKLSKYNQVVLLLEAEHEAMEESYKKRGLNPVVAFFILLGGICAALLTILWITQITLCVLVPYVLKRNLNFGFMSYVLIELSDTQLLAPDLVIYSLLCGYLVMAALHGNIRISMRFQSCLPLEPLKKGDTHLNALLFHIALFLMCTCAVVKLGLDAFVGYAVGTEANKLFNMAQDYMRIFSIFYAHHVFEWMMLCVTFVAFVWLSIFPEDKPAYNLNDPDTQQKWNKLQKELGIEIEQGLEEPVKEEEGPTLGDRARAKIAGLDDKIENAPKEFFGMGVTAGAKNMLS